MNKEFIESKARELHREVWRHSASLWPGRTGLSIVEIVDPEVAAKVLGIDYQTHPDLKWFTHPLAPHEETAGVLDREEGRILIADEFSFETRRFTAAHEIGHFLLHENVEETLLHRDRPIDGLTREKNSRPWYEKEADYFSACFLMPRRRVIETFEYAFSMRAPFIFDRADAEELCPQNPDSLWMPKDSLARAMALASVTRYRRKHFVPLHQVFRVSVTSMAIRIKELGLIQG